MSVVVRPVSGWRDRREFVELPYRLHSTSGVWVPPLRLERHIFLMRSQNAFFSHGDAQLFLAWRDGRVVGRISAQYDDNFNAYHDTAGDVRLPRIRGRAGHPAAAAGRGVDLAARSRPRPHGRADGLHDERRVRRPIDGFERMPFLKQPWHPPYYAARCEEAGLAKAVDLYMYELVIDDRSKILPVVFKLAEPGRVAARDHDPAHVAALAAARPGPLRRGLQRGLERELGLRALLRARPRRLRAGDAARLRPELVHGRRDGRGRHRRGGHHRRRTSTRCWPR